MKTVYKKGFLRDLKILRNDAKTMRQIQMAIEQIEAAESSVDIRNVSKMQGWKNYYRVRVGDYRIGIKIESETITFIRCLKRSEIYDMFP